MYIICIYCMWEQHSLVYLSPQNGHALRPKQPGWPCPSARPCSGCKPRKWPTEVAPPPLVPRGQRLPTWKSVIMCHRGRKFWCAWNDTWHFPLDVLFFWGGWNERDDKHIWKTNWLVPSKNNCIFLSGWHPASLWSKVHQELSDELDEKVKYVLALVRLFPMKRGIRCSSQVNVAEGLVKPWVTWFWNIA